MSVGEKASSCLWALWGKEGGGGGEGVLGSWEAVRLSEVGTLWPWGQNQFPIPCSDSQGLAAWALLVTLHFAHAFGSGCILRSTSGFPQPAVQFGFYLIAVRGLG